MKAPYVVPIDVGDMEWDHSEAVYRQNIGVKIREKFVCWYIGGTDVPILVDSGFPDEAHAKKFHGYVNPSLSSDQQMGNALKKKGIDPESIKIVIQTHLHWDHCGNLNLFPNAQILVSDKELAYALNPLPIHYAGYDSFPLGSEPLWIRAMNRVKVIKMKDQEISTGVRIIPTPGHTPGGIGVFLETGDGPYVIAGDVVYLFKALNPDPVKKLPFSIPAVFTDVFAIWESIERMIALVGGDRKRVLPGHDHLVFAQDRYPK